MPSLLTLIRDLETRSISKVGFPAGGTVGGTARISIIAREANLQFDETPVSCDIVSEGGSTALKLVVDTSPGRMMANGLLLGLELEWSTVAEVTRIRRFVIGRGYAGCLYTVLDGGNGNFMCVHTSREGGKSVEATTDKLLQYVLRNRLRVVHQVPTSGLIGQEGCTQVYMVTRVDYTINPRPRVETARLQINAAGLIAKTDVFIHQ